MNGFQLRALRVTGPGKRDAEITFGTGLNVVSGPSDTGKSYLVEAIDFMLGGATPPRQIPESGGYDQAHLAIESNDGKSYVLTRALQGGDFVLSQPSTPGVEHVTLAARHSATDPNNISTFLLGFVELDGKRLRKNVNNELQNLSFRNLAPLVIVDEESIIKKSSPVFTGESTQRTAQASVLKLLLTGLDDSALVATKKRAIVKAEIEGQIAVLDQLIADFEAELNDHTDDPSGLAAQDQRLEAAILASERALATERSAFQEQERARREAWATRERIEIRESEIDGLDERFALLDQSYSSDLNRLNAIAEAGQHFVALAAGTCPLCGAPAGDHRHEGVPHDGDIERLRIACASEITKINQLRLELGEATSDMRRERETLRADAHTARASFLAADEIVRDTLTPALSVARQHYDELLTTRARVRNAIGLADRLNALRLRKSDAEAALSTAGKTNEERPGLPAASVQALSVAVEMLLEAWHFPYEKPVYYEEKNYDLVLGSRRRGEQGKGLRALTHAAFTIGLQLAIKTMKRKPTGFIVLDSPLVTFREADHEDDLAPDQKIHVKQAFYKDLTTRSANFQIIIVENEDPTADLLANMTTHFFTKQATNGRYGFFPI
ncbi:AAA family ATPase [Bradyrhizobium tunisiense]|uniref:AAA family ATPase n=1 Tax=Bradyrhizobium tunisiense TaxID=3278709 RepID=UPI0035DAA383